MPAVVSKKRGTDNGSGVDASQKQKAKETPAAVDDAKHDGDANADNGPKDTTLQETAAAEDDAKHDGDANADNASVDAPEPIVGWKPERLDGNKWGSGLTGEPVADLPQNLVGAPILVTDSKGKTWTTTITEVVRRDDKKVIVRDAGRQKPNRGDSPQAS